MAYTINQIRNKTIEIKKVNNLALYLILFLLVSLVLDPFTSDVGTKKNVY